MGLPLAVSIGALRRAELCRTTIEAKGLGGHITKQLFGQTHGSHRDRRHGAARIISGRDVVLADKPTVLAGEVRHALERPKNGAFDWAGWENGLFLQPIGTSRPSGVSSAWPISCRISRALYLYLTLIKHTDWRRISAITSSPERQSYVVFQHGRNVVRRHFARGIGRLINSRYTSFYRLGDLQAMCALAVPLTPYAQGECAIPFACRLCRASRLRPTDRRRREPKAYVRLQCESPLDRPVLLQRS